MHRLCAFAFMMAPVTSFAITGSQDGIDIQVLASAGVGSHQTPLRFRAGPGLSVPVTFWNGNYDRSFALGRYWGGGLNPSLHFYGNNTEIASPVTVERGMDLIVASIKLYGSFGPLVRITDDKTYVGGTLRAGAAFKYRLTKNTGPIIRLQVGVDHIENKFAPHAEIQLGAGFSFRMRKSGVDDEVD